jgi:hypothetical protein
MIRAAEGYGRGTDDYGFSALPGGDRSVIDGYFSNAGSDGTWWADMGGAAHLTHDKDNIRVSDGGGVCRG